MRQRFSDDAAGSFLLRDLRRRDRLVCVAVGIPCLELHSLAGDAHCVHQAVSMAVEDSD